MNKLLVNFSALTLLIGATACTSTSDTAKQFKLTETGTVAAEQPVTVTSTGFTLDSLTGNDTQKAIKYTITLKNEKELVITQDVNPKDKPIVVGDTVTIVLSDSQTKITLLEPSAIKKTVSKKIHHKTVDKTEKKDPCGVKGGTLITAPVSIPTPTPTLSK